MSNKIIDVGSYIDPNLIDTELLGIGNGHVSWEGDVMSIGGEVPMVDGSIAIVDENGIITGYK